MSNVVLVKSKVEISQNFVDFSEYMNFKDGPVRKIALKNGKIAVNKLPNYLSE